MTLLGASRSARARVNVPSPQPRSAHVIGPRASRPLPANIAAASRTSIQPIVAGSAAHGCRMSQSVYVNSKVSEGLSHANTIHRSVRPVVDAAPEGSEPRGLDLTATRYSSGARHRGDVAAEDACDREGRPFHGPGADLSRRWRDDPNGRQPEDEDRI